MILSAGFPNRLLERHSKKAYKKMFKKKKEGIKKSPSNPSA